MTIEDLEREENNLLLYELINKLDTLERQVIIIYFGLEGQEINNKSKIAEILKTTPYKVNKALNKGIEKLSSNKNKFLP